jgi:hypothetical protein
VGGTYCPFVQQCMDKHRFDKFVVDNLIDLVFASKIASQLQTILVNAFVRIQECK